MTVRAAGAIPVRRIGNSSEVLLVHRPKYGDWSFPKGKAVDGETDEEVALDVVRWVSVDDALRLLTWQRDRDLLAAVREQL